MNIDIIAYFQNQAALAHQQHDSFRNQQSLLSSFQDKIGEALAGFQFVDYLENGKLLIEKAGVKYKCSIDAETEIKLIVRPYDENKATQFNSALPIEVLISDCKTDVRAKEYREWLSDVDSIFKEIGDLNCAISDSSVLEQFIEEVDNALASNMIMKTIGHSEAVSRCFDEKPPCVNVEYEYGIPQNEGIIICRIKQKMYLKVKTFEGWGRWILSSILIKKTEFELEANYYDNQTIKFLEQIEYCDLKEDPLKFSIAAFDNGILPDSVMLINSEQGIITLDDESMKCKQKEQLEAIALGMFEANIDLSSLYEQTRCELENNWLKKGFGRVLKKGSDSR